MLFLRRRQEQRRSFPWWRAGRRIFCFILFLFRRWSKGKGNNSTRLRDSVRQATSQVQRRSQDVGSSPERPCLARGDCCPPGKGCNRAGPSSRDEAGVLQPLLHRTQERWWPSASPPLRALPVFPCVHEGCRRRPYPVTGSGRQDPQLPRRLAYPSPIQRAVERSQ